MNKTILIVDDDKKIANLIDFRLKKRGYATQCAFRGQEALEAISRTLPPLVMLDVRLPDMSGVEVLRQIKKNHPQTRVLMISAHGDVKIAVDCMKLGAYDFIEKPFVLTELDTKVKNIFDQLNLEEEVSTLKRELGEKYKFKNMLGKSAAMKKVFHCLDLAAKSEVNVLIEGESGTGKELAARAIHFNSAHKNSPFIAVNCAAIPETLLESELFGHEKGAFTGATARRIGKFEQAQGGTLFLDEIGDLPLALQVKLLRVLQEREVERVGGNGPVPIQVRFIVATHRDLKDLVQQEKFREDLYFRVNVFPIPLPPLRERKEDIPELLRYFFQKNSPEKTAPRLEPDALKFLMHYPWPGNIRELENFVARLLLVKKDIEVITAGDIQPLLDAEAPVPGTLRVAGPFPLRDRSPKRPVPAGNGPTWKDKEHVIQDTEKSILEKALQQSGGNVSKACRLIHISRDTFYRKMKKYAEVSESSDIS